MLSVGNLVVSNFFQVFGKEIGMNLISDLVRGAVVLLSVAALCVGCSGYTYNGKTYWPTGGCAVSPCEPGYDCSGWTYTGHSLTGGTCTNGGKGCTFDAQPPSLRRCSTTTARINNVNYQACECTPDLP